ncbi:MAG: hypothetical protein HY340_02150 [Candidatus Kerfeldbacteria bacterium]|nr:hypothetical protein [Candidatus Kerfeldbacteria bacterium]
MSRKDLGDLDSLAVQFASLASMAIGKSALLRCSVKIGKFTEPYIGLGGLQGRISSSQGVLFSRIKVFGLTMSHEWLRVTMMFPDEPNESRQYLYVYGAGGYLGSFKWALGNHGLAVIGLDGAVIASLHRSASTSKKV